MMRMISFSFLFLIYRSRGSPWGTSLSPPFSLYIFILKGSPQKQYKYRGGSVLLAREKTFLSRSTRVHTEISNRIELPWPGMSKTLFFAKVHTTCHRSPNNNIFILHPPYLLLLEVVLHDEGGGPPGVVGVLDPLRLAHGLPLAGAPEIHKK